MASSSPTPNLMVTSHILVNGKKEKSSLYGIHHGQWQFLSCRLVPRVFCVPGDRGCIAWYDVGAPQIAME